MIIARPESVNRAFQHFFCPNAQLGVATVAPLQFVAGEPVGHAARPRRVQGPSGLGLEQASCELVSMALWFAEDAE